MKDSVPTKCQLRSHKVVEAKAGAGPTQKEGW